jgi:hypothetical protein
VADDGAPKGRVRIAFLAETVRTQEYRSILENAFFQMDGMPVLLLPRWVVAFPGDEGGRRSTAQDILNGESVDGVAWCRLEAPERLYLLYRAGGSSRLVVRELSGTGREGVEDAVGLILRGTVEALLEERKLVASALPVAAPSPPPAEPPSPARRMEADLAWALQLVSAQPRFSHGFRLSLGWSFVPALRGFAGMGFAGPVESSGDTAAVTVRRVPFFVGLGLSKILRQWRIGVSAAAVAALEHARPRALDASVTVTGSTTRAAFSAELLLVAHYRIRRRLALFTGAGVEAFFDRHTYRVINGPVLYDDIWPVQARFLVGLSVVDFSREGTPARTGP